MAVCVQPTLRDEASGGDLPSARPHGYRHSLAPRGPSEHRRRSTENSEQPREEDESLDPALHDRRCSRIMLDARPDCRRPDYKSNPARSLAPRMPGDVAGIRGARDRKSTRLNSSHTVISY